jgi:DNA-binding transcriptional MerR regulator
MAQTYWGSEVAKNLGIGSSTLRKYCLALEEAGYPFERGNNNSRIFYHTDVATIERLVTAMNKKNVTLEQAINLAMTSVEGNEIATVAIDSVADTEQIKALSERIERLEQLNLELIQRLDQQSKLLQETDAQRIIREEQRDVQLMQVLKKEIQDSKRLIAASEQRKSLWVVYLVNKLGFNNGKEAYSLFKNR